MMRLVTHLRDALIAGAIGLVVCSAIDARVLSNPKAAVDSNMLPMLLISYAFGLAYGMDTNGGSIAPNNALGNTFHSLEHALESLNADIPRKLAFVRASYVAQPSNATSRIIGQQGVSSLYVTDPLKATGNGVIAVISSTSPESTTIFSIDQRFNARLLYDSTIKNRFAAGMSCEPLGEIDSVEISKTGDLILHEMNRRSSADHHRIFNLDPTGQQPELQCSAR